MEQAKNEADTSEILPVSVPVEMPALPPTLVIRTIQQFKAISDPVRSRILKLIQYQPATAKQIAERLHIPHGTVGHHLQVLEAAGLAQVVARRLVRGIVAKYYSRTARIFVFDMPPEVAGEHSIALDLLTQARDELAEALATGAHEQAQNISFPHVRLSTERAQHYKERLLEMVRDLLNEQPDPAGEVYGVCLAFFKSPAYMQELTNETGDNVTAEEEGK